MTRCSLTTRYLTEYAAGELDAPDRPLERAIVAEHLAECTACRGELAREERLRERLGELPPAVCPDELTDAIMSAVDTEPVAPRRPMSVARTWASTGSVVALVAAAVLLVVVLPRSTPPPTTVADSWTQAELDQAREDAQWALVFTADITERSEKKTIVDVMRRLQQEAYSGFRERPASTSTGGQG